MVARRLVLGLFLATMLLAAPARALHANGLPARSATQPRGLIVPDRATPVGVAGEVLTFDFRGASPNRWVWTPRVTAAYVLRNPSPRAQPLTVGYFYLTRFRQPRTYLPASQRTPEVSWNGEPVPVRLPEFAATTDISADLGELELHWLDPATGEVYAVRPVQGGHLQVVFFNVDMPPESEGTLRVRYRQRNSGCDECNRRIGKPIWHYTYLLRPARSWAFFERLTLRALVPRGMRVASEPALRRAGAGVWERRFSSLPSGDFHLSVRPPGHVDPGRWALGIAAAAAILWLLRRRVRRRRHARAGGDAPA